MKEAINLTEEITVLDRSIYDSIINIELTDDQKSRIANPENVYPEQDSIMAIHWHPEFIPLDLIMSRVHTMFPNSKDELIVPTQHNQLVELNGFTGVEIDCYSKGFNRKVQLLAHFESSKLENADVFKKMLSHTFSYRTSQLYEFIDTILNHKYEDRVISAAGETGADHELIRFVRIGVQKVKSMIEQNYNSTPKFMIRNKLLKNYFDMLRDFYDDS